MKSIRERAEIALSQALRCVQYRLPGRQPLKPMAYTCALGLRYGMLGTAAAFYALETADIDEEPELKTVFQSWPLMVVDHFRHEIAYRLPFEGEPNQAQVVAKLSSSPLRVSLALRKQFLPLQRVLEISSDIFCRDHRGDITSDSWMFGKLKTVKLFKLLADESIRFSLCFLERRRVGLEEVSEIALLGE